MSLGNTDVEIHISLWWWAGCDSDQHKSTDPAHVCKSSLFGRVQQLIYEFPNGRVYTYVQVQLVLWYTRRLVRAFGTSWYMFEWRIERVSDAAETLAHMSTRSITGVDGAPSIGRARRLLRLQQSVDSTACPPAWQ